MTESRQRDAENPRSDAHTPVIGEERSQPKDDVRRRCIGTVRSTGEQCKKFPIKYATQCASHGNAPQIRAAAKRREIEAGAMVALSKANIAPLDDPLQALLDLGAEMIAFKDLLGTQVEQLNAADLTHVDRQGQQFIAAIANSFSQAMKDAGQLLVQINKLDLLTRRTNIAAAEAGMLVEALKRAVYCPEANIRYEQGEAILAAVQAEFIKLQDGQ